MGERIAHPVRGLAQEAAAVFPLFLLARQAQGCQRREKDEKSERVAGEGKGDTAGDDDGAPRRRADEAGAVEDDGVERDGRGKGIAVHQAVDERHPRRAVERGIDAAPHRERTQ